MSESSSSTKVDSWFEALAELTSVGVLMFDAEGEIQFAGGIARDLLQCKDEENLRECIEPLAQCVADANAGCEEGDQAKAGAPIHECFTVDAPDGPHNVAVAAHAIRTEECVGVLVLLSDQDQYDLMEKDLRLASRFRQVGQLYQAMAHDLRSPVATITMAASVLRTQQGSVRRQSDSPAAKMTQWLDAIEEAVGTLDHSLNLLLGELSSTDQRKNTFDLREVLESVYKIILPQARQWDIAISLDYPQGPSITLHGSTSRLKLAILNIVTNAVQAMAEGGKLTLGLESLGNSAHIIIQDTGPGIDDLIRDRIFDKYYTTKESGTGIGLYLAKEIVEEHGGEIGYQTGSGGTTFTLTFPPCATDNQGLL